jgi:DNA polymerase III sliding clamp (beta) subunit (PCNA family)
MKNNIIIELPVTELRNALTGLIKVIGRRASLPVLQSVRVARDKAGVITLQGTDLDSCATFTMKERNEGPATHLLVPFERLQKAVKQTNGKVELFITEKDQVIVRTFWRDTPIEEKIEVPFNDDWPSVPKVQGESITLDEQFRDAFNQAKECASTDESRYVLNSMYLDVTDEKAHYLVSTNSRVLFSANSFCFDLKHSLVIPSRKFLAWNDWWTEGNATLTVQPATKKVGTWLQLAVGPWTFVTKGIDEQYPKWRNIVPTETVKTTIRIPQQAVDSVLQIIARIPGDDLFNHDLTLNATQKTLVLQGKGKGQEQAISVPVVEAIIEGKANEVILNRHNFALALQFGFTRIEIVDDETPVAFRDRGKTLFVAPLKDRPRSTPAATPVAKVESPSTTTTPAQPTEPVQHERTTMPRQTTVAPVNGEQQESPLKQLIQQIENIKETLKGVIGELNTALDVVKKAEKEKRGTEKEMAAIRDKVRDIQSFSI